MQPIVNYCVTFWNAFTRIALLNDEDLCKERNDEIPEEQKKEIMRQRGVDRYLGVLIKANFDLLLD